MRKKAVIFDLDGVLVDSEYHYIQQLVDFSILAGRPLSFEKARLTAGVAFGQHDALIAQLLQMDKEELEKTYYPYRREHSQWDYRDLIIEDSFALLKYLRTTDVKLGLASASTITELKRKIEPTHLKEYFDVVLSGQMLKHTKPHPEIYIKALELLNCKPEECIAIEDSRIGIQSAHNAGIMVIARHDSRIDNDTHLADRVVEDMRTLIPDFETGVL